MTKAYVAEYAQVVYTQDGKMTAIPVEPALAEYVVDYTSGEAHGATFQTETRFVWYSNDSIASWKIGSAATATTSNKRVPAGTIGLAGVQKGAGHRISFITNT